MDLNSKQIHTILTALQIASETIKIQHAQKNVKERIYSQTEQGREAFHAEQVRAIELAADMDQIIPDFLQLKSRSNYSINQE